MVHIVNEIEVCDCCALVVANADSSGCEFNCGDGHVDRLAQFGLEAGENVVIDMDRKVSGMIRCAGCGDDAMDGWIASVLSA